MWRNLIVVIVAATGLALRLQMMPMRGIWALAPADMPARMPASAMLAG